MTFDPDEALRILRDNGVDASLRRSFGDESLPDSLVVLSGTVSRRPQRHIGGIETPGGAGLQDRASEG
jgi:hypothetical protein